MQQEAGTPTWDVRLLYAPCHTVVLCVMGSLVG